MCVDKINTKLSEQVIRMKGGKKEERPRDKAALPAHVYDFKLSHRKYDKMSPVLFFFFFYPRFNMHVI